jgi:hypothetical protein
MYRFSLNHLQSLENDYHAPFHTQIPTLVFRMFARWLQKHAHAYRVSGTEPDPEIPDLKMRMLARNAV